LNFWKACEQCGGLKNTTIALFVFEIDLFFNCRRYFVNCSTDFNSVRGWLTIAGSTVVGEKIISKVKRAIFKEHI